MGAARPPTSPNDGPRSRGLPRAPLPAGEQERPGPRMGAAVGFVAVAALAAGALWGRSPSPAPPNETDDPAPTASASAPVAPRCTLARSELTVGDKASAKLASPELRPANSAGAPATDDDGPDDAFAPFAAEVGRGAATPSGFVVGARYDASEGAVAFVARVSADGEGTLVKLGRTRGDLDPPTVAARGDDVFAALLEPGPNARTVRLARVSAKGEVTWGMTEREGDDESLALDLAVSGQRGAIVWDDVRRERAGVVAAVFDASTLAPSGPPVRLSAPDRDGALPRIAARPGGFWAAWIATGAAPPERAAAPNEGDPEPAAEPAKRAPKSKSRKDASPSPEAPRPRKKSAGLDEERGGELLQFQWLEVQPLDESGAPLGPPRAVSSAEGRVLAFDLEPLADGGVRVAFRDDDTPSGSTGGALYVATVTLSGVSEPRLLASGDAGIPDLLGAHLALESLSGPPRLGTLAADGALVGELRVEPALRGRSLLAASGDHLFLARPAGKLVHLGVARCALAPTP
jgi:hypothetical protein